MTKKKKKSDENIEETGNIGKVNLHDLRKVLQQNHKGFDSYNQKNEESPTQVKEWIPTGSRWLDSIINRGSLGGIPVGKISELAGHESCVTEDTLIEVIVEEDS